MSTLNKPVIGWVRDELENQARSLTKIIRLWVIEPQEEELDNARRVVHELRGVGLILGMRGTSELMLEFQDILSQDKPLESASQAVREQLVEIAEIFEAYLTFVLQHGKDNPLLIMHEVNALREVNKKPLLTEGDFLFGARDARTLVNTRADNSEESRLIIRRARHMYQQGLLNVIRGRGKSGSIRVLGHAVRRVQQTIPQGEESLYWLMILQVLEAFAKNKLRLTKERLRSLMALERQMRALMDNATPFAKAYPESAQHQMLALFKISGLTTPQAKNVAEKLSEPLLEVTDESLAADRALFGSESALGFSDTMSVLRDNLDSLSFLMDQLETGKHFDLMDRENLNGQIKEIAELTKVTGLVVAGQRFAEHDSALRQHQNEEDVPSELVNKIVESTLYLSALLVEMNNLVPSEEELKRLNGMSVSELVETNVHGQARIVVIDEMRASLQELMSRINEAQQGYSEENLFDLISSAFAAVTGAALILNMDKAAEISSRCVGVLDQDLVDRLLGGDNGLSALADIIVSLEYYLENSRWDKNFDTSMLNVAVECLDSLEAA